jgi:hypothetical protein
MLALTFMLAAVVTQASGPLPLFELHTGGGPGGPRFHVTLSPQGRLTVEKEAMPITETGLTRSTTTLDLSQSDAAHLLSLARRATDFSKGCNNVADGTSAVLVIPGSKGRGRRTCEGLLSGLPAARPPAIWLS